MTREDVLRFLTLMEAHGVDVWLDGGWAVDACLGTQTRPHADLDIAIEQRHLWGAAVDALRRSGFGPVPQPYRGFVGSL